MQQGRVGGFLDDPFQNWTIEFSYLEVTRKSSFPWEAEGKRKRFYRRLKARA